MADSGNLTCLKCGSQISHIPYRYNGQTFHARCLLCNACGRRLIGKPFITQDRQIFCGDQCLDAVNKGKIPKSSTTELSARHKTSLFQSNSLEDILEDTNSLHEQMATRLVSPVQHFPTALCSRMTDYPVSSPRSSHTGSFRSETDSVSTMSESSFTSDSSFAFDARKRPKKKILKPSNAPKKKHKNRVRWDLNNLESVSDADSLSTESSSFYGGNHGQILPPHLVGHYNGNDTARTLHNWRDFDRSLPPGSTGLTPSKMGGSSQGLSHPQPSTQHLSNGHIYRTYSDNLHTPSKQHYQMRQSNSLGRIVNVPVLHLDEKEIPQLDESNMEERQARRLFGFPNALRKTPLNDDDQNDYDHLQPTHSTPTQTARDKLTPPQPDFDWYSSEDIDEALKLINDDGNISSNEEEDPPPPPIPPKRISSLKQCNSTQPNAIGLESTDSKTPQQGVGSKLHSPSMETLLNYEATPPVDDGLTPEIVHPENTFNGQPQPSWGGPSLKIKDRIVEGAEDPQRDPSPTHKPHPKPINGLIQNHTQLKAMPPMVPSPLTRHDSLSPKKRHTSLADKKLHNSTIDLTSDQFTEEEKAVIQWYRNPNKMKPIVVDTDKEIEQMLADLSTKKHRSNSQSSSKKYFGTCCSCQKTIESSQNLLSFASRLYHLKCFSCSQCGSPLKGKQVYTLKGTLVCHEDYEKMIKLNTTQPQPAAPNHSAFGSTHSLPGYFQSNSTHGSTHSLQANTLRKDSYKAQRRNSHHIIGHHRFFPKLTKSHKSVSSATVV